MRKCLILIAALTLGGCCWSAPMHKISPGLSKEQVLEQIGKPAEASGSGGQEYLWYFPADRLFQRYYVRLSGGKVDAYGKVGGWQPVGENPK